MREAEAGGIAAQGGSMPDFGGAGICLATRSCGMAG